MIDHQVTRHTTPVLVDSNELTSFSKSCPVRVLLSSCAQFHLNSLPGYHFRVWSLKPLLLCYLQVALVVDRINALFGLSV